MYTYIHVYILYITLHNHTLQWTWRLPINLGLVKIHFNSSFLKFCSKRCLGMLWGWAEYNVALLESHDSQRMLI